MGPAALWTSGQFKTYTLGASDIDLISENGEPCREIVCNADCALVVTPASRLKSQAASTDDSTFFLKGTPQTISVTKIKGTGAGSTPGGTLILVKW